MKSNNPFTTHNIEHLSASKINLWVNDPAKFIATYLCGMKSTVGAGAFRGTSVEVALSKKLEDRTLSYEAIDEFLFGAFDKECIEHNVDTESETAFKERKGLHNYFNSIMELYNDFEKPKFYQYKMHQSLHEDLPIPFLGYIDFVFEDSVRDLKTTARMPSKISEAHQRQLAIYSQVFPDKELWVDYSTPKQAMSYKLENKEQKLKEVIKISFGLMKFLSISNDPFELASMIYPNLDSWMWNEEDKKQSTTIWSNE